MTTIKDTALSSLRGNIRQEFKDRHQANRSFNLKPLDKVRSDISTVRRIQPKTTKNTNR